MLTFRPILSALSLALFLNGCAKDKAADAGPAAPSGCTAASETWTVSDSLSGALTFSRDVDCNTTVSGTLRTSDGDSIVFTSAPVAVDMESFSFSAPAASFLVQTGSCTLRVSGSAIEGSATGAFTLSFASGSGTHTGSFTAVRTSGAGVTPTAAALSAGAHGAKDNQENMSFRYSVDGHNLTLTYVSREVMTECIGDSLIREIDSSTDVEVYQYQLSEDSLTLLLPINLFGAEIQFAVHHARNGEGSGIQGLWTCTGMSYTVLSGTISDENKALLDGIVADFEPTQVEFTDTEMREIDSDNNNSAYSPADVFISSWDTSYYSITVTKISDYCVLLEGNTTGENVVIAFFSDRTVYYSSDYTHETHTYYDVPEECPNDYRPGWYYAFQSANGRMVYLQKTEISGPPAVRRMPAFLKALFSAARP